jgi:hypothetical protein
LAFDSLKRFLLEAGFGAFGGTGISRHGMNSFEQFDETRPESSINRGIQPAA